MDGELPPWNKHGSHNSGVPCNTAGERQEEHDVMEDGFSPGEPMTTLSSCMSGAFKTLLPDYHGASSSVLTNSNKYSYSDDNQCLAKPGTAVDDNTAVERREESDFLKDPLGEALAGSTHMLPLRCAQYVTHEKNREMDQGNGNWTSVIKDALEMSNGMEMEQTMNERGPLMDYNPMYKLNEKMDGQGVKDESDSFISMLSDDVSKNKDVLEMGKHEEPSILDVGSSLSKEELGITGIREREPGLSPGFNRSSYTVFSSSESLTKREQFPCNPLENQSVNHTLQLCKDVSPRKIFKHAEVNNETVPEGSTLYGLHHHHFDLQKGCHQAEEKDGKTSQDHNVPDDRVKSNPHVSETTVIKQNPAYLPNTQYFGGKLKKQVYDLVQSPASVSSQNTEVEHENLKLLTPTEESTSKSSLPVTGKMKTNDIQETSINTQTELNRIETNISAEIQYSSSVSETVSDLPVIPNRIYTECRDSQFESVRSGKLHELCFQESSSKNETLTLTSTSVFTQRTADLRDLLVQEKQTPLTPSTVLLPYENGKNSERSEKVNLNIISESSIPPSAENVQEAPPSATRIECSSQNNLQKTLLKPKKPRKRKQSELEALKGPIYKSNKSDCSMYESEILDTGCEKANQNIILADHDSTEPKEEDLIANGDVNLATPGKKLLADTAETSQQPDHSGSAASQEVEPPNTSINRKKLKKKTRLHSKDKESATLEDQYLSQSTVLSPDEDHISHFQVSDTTSISNPAVNSSLESTPEKLQKSRKKTSKQTLQNSEDPHSTMITEVELDMNVKGHQKVKRSPLKASKKKNKSATSPLDRSSQDSEGQTDSVSISVTESLKILSPQNDPKKSKQNKRVHINNAAKTPNVCPQEDMENMMTPKTKTVKSRSPLKKAARIDDNESALLDPQPSTATAKQPDSNIGNEVESLSTPRKSPKKKWSHIKGEATHVPAVEQTTAQQSVLNSPSESDINIVQVTSKRVGKRRKTDIKLIEAQLSTTSQQDNVISPPSEDFSSIVVSNPEETTIDHSADLFKIQASTVKYSKITSDIKREAVHTHTADQTMQQEIHPFDSTSTTEMDNSDVLKQKKTKVKMKKPKKATKCTTHISQAVSDISTGTSALEVRNDQSEHMVLPLQVFQNKDSTQDPCMKTDYVNEMAENQVSITTKDVASPRRSPKAAKKKQKKQLLEQKNENEQSNILELAHREDKMPDFPPVVGGVASETFETDNHDKHLMVAKKKSMEIAEAHGFTNVSVSQENHSGADEAGVMVTFTQVADLCKLSDSQTVGSQQPEKDDAVIDQIELQATNPPKKRGRKPGRKKRRLAYLLTQTIKEEEHKDVRYDNTIASDFQDNTQTKISEISQRINDFPEEPVLKSRKSTRTQKINSDPENLTHGESAVSLDITGCHTTLGETLSSLTQTVACAEQNTVEKKRRGRPPSKKSKKQKLVVAHLENNTFPSVQKSDLSLSQDSTENTVKAAASPLKTHYIDTNITKQLGTDSSESLQSANGLSISTSGLKKDLKRLIRDPNLTSLRASSRTCVTSVKGFEEADITSLPQNSTDVFEEGKTALQDDNVLADIKIENKTTVKVLSGRKRGRKRRKTRQLQNSKTQDYCEPVKGLLTNLNMICKCPTEDQNNTVTPEAYDTDKTKSEDVEMIGIEPKTEILCSPPSDLSSSPMKKVKYKVEKSNTGNTRVSRRICNLISSNVAESSEPFSLDTQKKPNIELKCTPEADGLNVKMSKKKVLDSPLEPENVLQPSAECKENSFTQDSEDCVVMPNEVTTNRAISSKPKDIIKKPLTCKYCGVSFRHITAYTVHRRVHTGDKPYKCKICGKAFSQLSKLKCHHNVHKQNTFPCPCCSRRFLQKDDLISHFKIHLQESKTNGEPQKHIKRKRNASSETPKNSLCLIRTKKLQKPVKLQNHMQVHEVEKSLTCKDCGKTFGKPSNLSAHEKTHWPVKPYACSICGKGFNQLKALKKHSQDHAGETPFSCFHCGHGFSALSALRMHQASKTCIARKNDKESSNIEGFIVSQGVDGQVNTPVFFKCQICKELFRKWCQYSLHLQTHTSSPPYICFSCGQCYEKDSEMNVHCEVCCQSSGEEKICGASLSDIMQSVTHKYPLKCTSSQSLGCKLDSQTQTNSEPLSHLPRLMDVEPARPRNTDHSKHPKTYSTHSPARSGIHSTSPSSSRECVETTPSILHLKRLRNLSAHLQTHAPGFRYACADCGQFFERWSKLWLHQQRHRLKKRCYSCTQCNLQFRFLSSFREHMIDHAGQRPYACPLCPKTFIQEASLHAHQCESHKLCKSLKCDVCSKTFSSLTNLIKHSLLHNGSTSHVCLHCNLSFTNARVLQEHLKTHTTRHEPALPDIPSKPLDFPHKCKRCQASFSTGDLLYAHQICHSRDPKAHIRPAVLPTSKAPGSARNDTPSTASSNHISNLNLDGVPNDDSLYVYSHPDQLYVSPRVQLPVINLDPDETEVSDSPELPNSEIASQSDGVHLPQATSVQETNLNSSESIKTMASGPHNYSPTFVETSVDMEVEHPIQEEESEESFECADCTEKLTSVLGLYEHYILHAMGDAYVQVH